MLAAPVPPSDRERDPDSSLKGSILCVDDEQQILKSLQRVFRRNGHKVQAENSASAALRLLEQNEFDLVISDMRMPDIDGNAFLAEVASRWPATVRLLLTGYSDMESTIGAINNGHIFRYIAKPWDENELLMTIQRALEFKTLRDERNDLVALTTQQNNELKALNSSLEEKVRQRTEQLETAARTLRISNASIKNAYSESIAVFSRLVGMREAESSAHGERVAELCDLLAQQLDIDDASRENLRYAALLHDIGKMDLPDSVLHTPHQSLEGDHLQHYRQHCINGEALLMSLGPLNGAAELIRSHHEYMNGSGFPDGLSGDEIPLGARILCIVNEFDNLCSGAGSGAPMDASAAVKVLKVNKGKRYDQEVLETFISLMADRKQVDIIGKELILTIDDVQPGMVLAEDVYLRGNVLMLRRGQVLTSSFIEKFRKLKRGDRENRQITVRT